MKKIIGLAALLLLITTMYSCDINDYYDVKENYKGGIVIRKGTDGYVTIKIKIKGEEKYKYILKK